MTDNNETQKRKKLKILNEENKLNKLYEISNQYGFEINFSRYPTYISIISSE